MIGGARQGKGDLFKKWFGAALAASLKAFVVPGPEFARRAGLDLAAAGIDLCNNPREANLLVVVGLLPPGLERAAAVIFSQMPHPRFILLIGEGNFTNLPSPDIQVEPSQTALIEWVKRLRKLITANSWAEQAPAFPYAEEDPEDNDGSEMDMGHNGMNMQHHSQGQPETDMSQPDMSMDHGGQSQAKEESSPPKSDEQMPGDGQDRMNMGDDHQMPMQHGDQMDMGCGEMNMDQGFMSMVAMTKDLPRSRDGLPMEWADAPFGPLFPGLPAGLALTFTLDGDSVAKVKLEKGIVKRDLEKVWPGRIEDFPDRFSQVEPATPLAYRFLAIRALAEAGAVYLDQNACIGYQANPKVKQFFDRPDVSHLRPGS